MISALPALAAVLLLSAGCGEEGAGGEEQPAVAKPRETAEPASGPPPLFEDVTEASGLAFRHRNGGTGRKYLPEIMGSGAAALDYDGDGWTDLYFVQSGQLPGAGPSAVAPATGLAPGNRLYRNRGDGTFEDVTERSGAGDRGYGMGAVAGDVEGDGDTDLYVVNLGPDRLLLNDGRGRFRDATAEAGIDSPLWGSSAALFDADLDGRLDIYVVNYLDFTVETHIDCGVPARGILSYCHPDVYPMAPDVFFHNRGDGTFEEATRAAGLVDTTGKGLGVTAADLTGDGWPDLYVANDSTPNFLYRNLGGGVFRDEALFLGVGFNEDGQAEAGMGVAVGDADADGRLDVFVTNLSNETNALYLGGDDMFRYATRDWGLVRDSWLPVGFGTDLADLDNDGDLDLVVVNGHVIDNIELTDDAQSFRQPAQVFWNDGAAGFRPVAAARIPGLRVPRVGRGTVTLDFDHDGGLDLAVSFNDEPARLFRNRGAGGSGSTGEPGASAGMGSPLGSGAKAGSWIQVRAVGAGGNREGVGVRVRVETPDGVRLEERSAGSSYQSSEDPRLHFGLGARARADRLWIDWPGGGRQELKDLPAGRLYRIYERQPDRKGA